VPHRVERERGDALEQLTACWRYHDLTVVGLRGLFEYGILRNPDDRIVRLILSGVRPIVAVAERHHPVQRVLIAFNGSMESAAAMKRFVQLRPWGDVSVEILCVGLEDDEAARALEDAAGYCRAHGLETRTTRIPGSPTDELLDHARAHGTDLVVMGATSHRKLVRLILGETVLHAMQHADIPLFLSR
jgi:nucleotide-binding universal stress UspA family protein